MSDSYYGLTAPPFQLTPDSRFYFASVGHARAVAHLTFGLAQGEGFILVTGEVGAGKTTLIDHLLGQLDQQTYVVSRVATTQVSADELFGLAVAGFGIDIARAGKATLLRRLEVVLRKHRVGGRRCLLIVDEAQTLPPTALEELRMLSNLTDGGQASLQTILLGQPQFRETLALPDLDQLRQRVVASCHLGALGEAETRAYVLHRLGAAGWKGRPAWEDGAFTAVFARCGGLPRRINRLCSRVLLDASLDQLETITAAMVQATASELAEDLEITQAPPPDAVTETVQTRLQGLEQRLATQEKLLRSLLAALDPA